MKARHIVENAVFVAVGWVIRLLPFRLVHVVGGSVAEFVYSVVRYRRRITLQNLRNAFPEYDLKSLHRIARGAFRTVGGTLFEFMWFPNLTQTALKEIIQLEDPDIIASLYARGKGVILLTLHFGNWEMLPQIVRVEAGLPVSVIAKPQSNTLVDKAVNTWRSKFGSKVIPMGVSVREVLRALERGDIVGLAADQTAAKQSISVEFFGRSVPTYEGPAAFSLKTGAPMAFGCAIRQDDGTYRLRFSEVPSDDLNGYSQENVLELTRRHVRLSEDIIRQYPEQWMWMHKRWKHVPDRVPLS